MFGISATDFGGVNASTNNILITVDGRGKVLRSEKVAKSSHDACVVTVA